LDLPVNKRFFPGGDNSIRGYREGQAVPLAPDGKYIGAKTYLLANVELEQALTPKWSAVIFGDALGEAARLADYPFSEKLYSVGLGVRYQTLIGPLRMEYGRNINPRPIDPRGTLLFSVGFPF
jgi:outer membrane translocation and assembly module TamA